MEMVNREELEKLAGIEDQLCVSIFIPTHKAGQEANDGTDILSLKNQVLDIKYQMQEKGHQEKEIEKFLMPFYDLMSDTLFWKYQDEGLAIFRTNDLFQYYRLPKNFKPESFLGKKFILNQLFSLLVGNGEFFLLAISQEDTRFFKADMYTLEEITHEAEVPTTIDSTLKYYEYQRQWQKGTSGNVIIGTSAASPNGSPGSVIFHGHGGETESFNDYIFEYLRYVNDKILKTLNKHQLPLLIAGVDYMLPIYKRANTYSKLIPESIKGNFDKTNDGELHPKAKEIMQKYFYDKKLKKHIEKYSEFSGTGKATANLDKILPSAKGGRIETLFIEENTHIWGNHKEDKIEIDKDKSYNAICLLNEAAIHTINNSGEVYLLPKMQMPKNDTNSPIVAIYRY
jgi:hypothetical protein